MSTEILEDLSKAIIEYDTEAAASLAQRAVTENIDPLEALNVLTVTISRLGEAFSKGELFLPELLGAADVVTAAMPIIEGEIRKRGEYRKSLGKVVIGTVLGDIHNIGKSMVATLLVAEGFIVYDLGIDVPAYGFIKAIHDYKADILAMSALLTTTATEQRKVIETMKEDGIRAKVKIMVGGGAITQEFANHIGADGYDPTAPGAVKLARNLINK
jgi:corrinoid protein of di/trimethylamine methyltransferase